MRRWKKNAAWGLVAMTMVMASLSGCGGNVDASQVPAPAKSQSQGEAAAQTQSGVQTETAGEPVTLTYRHHDASENIAVPLKKVIADFGAENPNIRTDPLALPADSSYQKYVTAVATNTTPDISGVRNTELLALVNQNAIVPLNDYLDQQGEKDKTAQNTQDSVNSYTEDGKTYMVSSYMNACTMWYSMKKMGEAGVEIPTTVDESLKNCETYAKPEESSYFHFLHDGVGSYDNLFTFLTSYAGMGGFFDKNGDCILNQDIPAEAMDNYMGVYKNGWVSRDSVTSSYKEMVAGSGSGISMSMSHNPISATNRRENLGEGNFTDAIHPAGKSGRTVVPAPSIIGAAVTIQSSRPAEATKFMEYLGAHSAASYFCRAAGKISVNDLMYEDQWYKEDPYMGKHLEIMSNDSVILYDNLIWPTEWASFTGQDITSDFQAVLMGDRGSKEVPNNWAERLTFYQQEYLKGRQ